MRMRVTPYRRRDTAAATSAAGGQGISRDRGVLLRMRVPFSADGVEMSFSSTVAQRNFNHKKIL
jgi:hypothetical protein